MTDSSTLAAARLIRDGGRLSETCSRHSRYTAGCLGCQRQSALRLRARSRARAYGWLKPAYVDATPAREHIVRLRDQHQMDYQRIAEAAQLTHATIRRIAIGEIAQSGGDTIERVVAVTPAPPRPLNGTTYIIGAARRLQALAYDQYTPSDLAPMLDAGETVIRRWRAARHPMISLRWHDRIAALADRLETVTGPSPRARAHALRMGWLPLAAWDDIDDPAVGPAPDSLPEPVAERRLSRGLVRSALAGRIPLTALTEPEQIQVWLRWSTDRAATGQLGGAKPFARHFQVNEWHARRLRAAAETTTTPEHTDNHFNRKVA